MRGTSKGNNNCHLLRICYVPGVIQNSLHEFINPSKNPAISITISANKETERQSQAARPSSHSC